MPANAALTDEEVVTRVRAGETALFEVVMRRHNQRLFRTIRAILRNDAEAEDALQQAYLSAYSHLGQFAGDAHFATWLTRIALNEAFSRSRRRVKLAEVDMDDEDSTKTATAGRSPEEQASSRELAGHLEEAIDALPEKYRVVVMMREVQELSTAETASCLQLTEEAVKVRLHRAKLLLREALYARLETRAPEAFAFLGPRCDRVVAAVLRQLGAAMSG